MSYEELVVSPQAPHAIRLFIREAVDPHLHDVHCMLRLPMKQIGLDAGCNFAIAQVLLNIISGVSAVLYEQGGRGRSAQLFKSMLEDRYWEIDPPAGIPSGTASALLYEGLRNPFAHALGFHLPDDGDQVNWLVVARLPSVTSALLYELEMSDCRPNVPPTVEQAGNTTFLRPEGLYWGTRRMIEKLTEDQTRMGLAAAYLADAVRTNPDIG